MMMYNAVCFQASTSVLCTVILDVISSIYHQDNANYFILEPQNTLSQFSEKIYTKPDDVQVRDTKWKYTLKHVLYMTYM